jgi:hypothetical protein
VPALRETRRRRQARVIRAYLDEAVHILELARNAQRLFEREEPRQKRRLLQLRTIELRLGGSRDRRDSANPLIYR